MDDDITLLLVTLGLLLLVMILLLFMMGYLLWLFDQDAQKCPRNALHPALPPTASEPTRQKAPTA